MATSVPRRLRTCFGLWLRFSRTSRVTKFKGQIAVTKVTLLPLVSVRLAGFVSRHARQGGADRAHATFILLGKARVIVGITA
jgi:hypothetical protein